MMYLFVLMVMGRVRHLSWHQLGDVEIHRITFVCLSTKNLTRLAVRLRIGLHRELIEDITLRCENLALPLRMRRQKSRQ